MAQRMVILKNMMNATVSVKKPEYGVNRRWDKRGQTSAIPYDTVEQLLWDDSFRRMIDCGILYIEDMQTKKDLGLEPEDAVEPVNIIALDEKKMSKLLNDMPITMFKGEISKLTSTQIDNLIDYSIENKIANVEKAEILKKISGRDILLAISRKQREEEEDKIEKEKLSRSSVEGRRV